MAIQSSYFDPADGSVGTVDLAFVPVRSLRIPLTAATTTTPGAVCSVANPEGVDLIVLSAQCRVDTLDVAATIDVGVAANGSTSASDLFSDHDVSVPQIAASAILGPSFVAASWGATQFVTGTASATLAGLTACLYVQYIPA